MHDVEQPSGELAHGSDHVAVEYHQFVVIDPATDERPDADVVNGLVGVTEVGAQIVCGMQMGDVGCEVSVRAEAPAAPTALDLERWDEIVDVSIRSVSGNLYVVAVDDEAPDLPNLCGSGPGVYRLRVHARGRDTHPSEIVDELPTDAEPAEQYLLITWRAEAGPATVHQTRDQFGKAYRDSIAG
ncbi:hypothetical protein ACQEVB_40775 [Pseudonocardia sp. CA-107938]|uniref:hypothetical protein n=1 Tax=Pseudonocardia sp. CA-107938 TaxID=3240021 RepID=UPI003D8ADCE2